MPLINEPIEYSAEEKQLIESKLSDANFNHTNWADDELQNLRSSIRNYYRVKQHNKCAFCYGELSTVSASNATIEHIAPKSLHRKFMFTEKNLCVICADCNHLKRSSETIENPSTRKRYPTSTHSFKIVHPHIDEYNVHILKKGRIYIDKTPKGQFTIATCKLNRFFHQFGYQDNAVNDVDILSLMNIFMSETSTSKKHEAIQNLIELLILNY